MGTIDAKILAVVERLDPARQQQLLDYEGSRSRNARSSESDLYTTQQGPYSRGLMIHEKR